MSEKRTWLLTDTASDVWTDSLHLGERELGCAGSIRKHTLHGGMRDGVDVVELNNGRLTVSVLPTRGMGIWKAWCDGIELGWQAPVPGPVNPGLVNLAERDGLGWLRGFDELVARCGLAWNGAPCRDRRLNHRGEMEEEDLTLHGRIANTPAHLVEASAQEGRPGTLCVTGRVEEAGLFSPHLRLESTVSLAAGTTAVTLRDRVINMGGTETEVELLYHCNFGPPLLEKGSRVHVPASERGAFTPFAAAEIGDWSVYRGPTAGIAEQVYWHRPVGDKLGNTLAVLHNRAGGLGVAVRFNVAHLPWFTLWKCTGAPGDGYVTGLEPGTDLPFPRPYERANGRLMRLAPGGALQATVTLEILLTEAHVQRALQEVETLQPAACTVFEALRPGYAPGAGEGDPA